MIPLQQKATDTKVGSTWRSERQSVVQTPRFGGDEQIAEDTKSDDECKKNHSCHGETHESSETAKQKKEHNCQRSRGNMTWERQETRAQLHKL